jgi:flagellar biosynthesis protein FlhB
MAESDADKTEAPTARRRQEARDAGNIARSPDLASAALLLGGLYLLKWFGLRIVGALRDVIAAMLSPSAFVAPTLTGLVPKVMHSIGSVGIAMAPVLGGAALIVIVVNLAQVGLYFNGSRITPNFAALNPLRGLRKIFGGGQGTVHLLMSLLKVVLVGMVGWSAVGNRMGQIVSIAQLTFVQIFTLGADVIFSIGLRIAILLLILAIVDYVYQRSRIEKSLRMTKQEVKDEMRSMDGDPVMKSRRRQVALQRHLQRLKKEVPKADVVVTNPTHFAVALKYEEGKMRAPKLVAKGADLMAFRIRQLAVDHGIPIVERPSVARAIYRTVDIGEEIPEDLYSAVAEILAYVYELNKKARRAVAV